MKKWFDCFADFRHFVYQTHSGMQAGVNYISVKTGSMDACCLDSYFLVFCLYQTQYLRIKVFKMKGAYKSEIKRPGSKEELCKMSDSPAFPQKLGI